MLFSTKMSMVLIIKESNNHHQVTIFHAYHNHTMFKGKRMKHSIYRQSQNFKFKYQPKWRLTQYPNKKGSNIWLKKVVYLFWDFLIWTWLSSMTTPQLWVRVNNAFSKSWKSTKRKRMYCSKNMAQVQVPEFIYIILNNMLRNVVFKLFTKYFIDLVAAQYITLIIQ